MSPVALRPFPHTLPVGPGSRGGHWHEAEYRRAYYRLWRASHPRYRKSERERSAVRRAIQSEVRARFGPPTATEVLQSLVREEHRGTTYRALAQRIAVDWVSLYDWATGKGIRTDGFDALFAYFGWNRVMAAYRAETKRRRDAYAAGAIPALSAVSPADIERGRTAATPPVAA